MRPDELERRLQERLDALGPAPRAELLHVLLLPDFERRSDRRVLELSGEPRLRRATDRLRGGSDAPGGGGRTPPWSACLGWSVLPRAWLLSLTYLSYRSRLMYGPSARVRFRLRSGSLTALPAPLTWQEGVILSRSPARLGSTNRCPGSPIQGPGATSGTPVYQGWHRWPGRVLPPHCFASYPPRRYGLDWEKR